MPATLANLIANDIVFSRTGYACQQCLVSFQRGEKIAKFFTPVFLLLLLSISS